MANNLTFNDCALLLTDAIKYATGQQVTTPLDETSFITVAQTALKTGYDPIMNGISQVLSKTIFSVRPYSAKFKTLMKDSVRWGNHVRKITVVDKAPEVDDRGMAGNAPVDGTALTPWKWETNQVVQTNFYGGEVYQRSIMLLKDQIDSAFSGSAQFGSFITMLMTNVSDMIEQDREVMSRMAVNNFIAGKMLGDTTNVIHLLTEYNAENGLNLTATTAMQPQNFDGFVKWMYARISNISDRMTERSINFHTNLAAGVIMRHTPKNLQKAYLYAPFMNKVKASVLSSTYHDNMLKMVDAEMVNYWQDIDSPDVINVVANYLQADGSIATGTVPASSETCPPILGVIFDEEAIGATSINEWSAMTPLDARHGITNQYWHYTLRYWNDFTENGVVLLLD